MNRWILLAMCLGTACTEMEGPPTIEGLEPVGDDLADQEGTWGRVTLNTVNGPRPFTYQVVNGHAIHEEDIDLGPVSQLRLRGGGANLAERWPNSVVYYAFEPSFVGTVCTSASDPNCVDVRARIRTVLAEMAVKLPLTFKELSTVDDTNGVLVFGWGPGQASPGQSDHTGWDGGEQHIRFQIGNNGDWLGWNEQPGPGTIRHETLHALGLWHEQTRGDRDHYVDIHWECIAEEHVGNYSNDNDSADLGPYDFQSIMHYGRSKGCLKPIVPEFEDPDGDGCVCLPHGCGSCGRIDQSR